MVQVKKERKKKHTTFYHAIISVDSYCWYIKLSRRRVFSTPARSINCPNGDVYIRERESLCKRRVRLSLRGSLVRVVIRFSRGRREGLSGAVLFKPHYAPLVVRMHLYITRVLAPLDYYIIQHNFTKLIQSNNNNNNNFFFKL